MTHLISKSIATLFFILFATSLLYAQESWSIVDANPNCLGIHCYISVDLNNDPIDNGYLKYTIPTPKEGIDFISGSAGCYLSNHLGNTVDVYVRRTHLELALDSQPYAQVPFELYIPLWRINNDVITTIPGNINNQLFYIVYFNMNSL